MSEAKGSEKTELNNSHYKAAAQDDLLASVDTLLHQMPYRHGFAPTRWKTMTAKELEKIEGNCLVTKLQIIDLMSSMFKTNNKKLGRDSMYQAKELDFGQHRCYTF
jgi:hypothetical protein